ncbi:MAG TPA: NFACT RNA binding domain-containing protein [Polyangiaceae bacterium]|nr:NFACT RNA binding domain-containing protein [Polyangiaceae bacterium]
MSSKGRPYRSFVHAGFEILVGKAASDNDHLTFNVAQPHDLWLHVAGGTPGSHVVIRNPDKGAVPEDVTRCAAALAAWYSKARNAARVEVHLCRAGDVKKARGAPAGQVQIARYKSIKVAPAPFPDGSGADHEAD